MSNRVFSPGSSPLEEGLPVPHRSEHHAELKHQTPVPPSFASALLSLNKQRPFTYPLTHPPSSETCSSAYTTYLPTSSLSRQNPYLPALHQSDHHYRPYNQAYRIDQPDRAERKGFESRRHSKYILHDYHYTRRDWH